MPDEPGDSNPALIDRLRSIKRGRKEVPEHAVFLVPGLLGFDSIATFSYFAERVVAALRASLELASERPVPVLALPIPPTASLRDRQRQLVASITHRLQALERGLPRPLRLHLVGHSTGGLDANLLLLDAPLDTHNTRASHLHPRAAALRERIDSIVSIASPHQGACFARDPLARLVGEHDPRGLPAAAVITLKFLVSVIGDVDVQHFVTSRLREFGKSQRLWNIATKRWPLMADLDPARMPVCAKLTRPVLRRSFVTISNCVRSNVSNQDGPDSLFRDLAQRASGLRTGCSELGELLAASVARVQNALSEHADELLIKSPQVEVATPFDAGFNDGVVNTARQLMDPCDPDELAGIVVADHFDVIGYYDRKMWVVDEHGQEQETTAVSGFLHSGSGFGDEQFFELYRRVGRVIVRAMH